MIIPSPCICRSVVLAFALLALTGGCGGRSIDRRLSDAAATGNLPEIRRLLSLGANVDCRDSSLNAWTPLFWALFEHNDEAAQALLAAGADPNLKDGTGKAPLAYAMDPGDRSMIIRALVLAGAKTEDYTQAFELLPAFDPNRVAFVEAIKLRNSRPHQLPSSPGKEHVTNEAEGTHSGTQLP